MQTDLLLLVLKLLLPRCPHLTVVLMSATMSLELFASYFDGCPVVGIEGRTFPVTAFYLEDILAATGHKIVAGSPAALKSAAPSSAALTMAITGAGGRAHTTRVQWEEEGGGDGGAHYVSESWEEGRYDAFPEHVGQSIRRCDEAKINFDLIEARARAPVTMDRVHVTLPPLQPCLLPQIPTPCANSPCHPPSPPTYFPINQPHAQTARVALRGAARHRATHTRVCPCARSPVLRPSVVAGALAVARRQLGLARRCACLPARHG